MDNNFFLSSLLALPYLFCQEGDKRQIVKEFFVVIKLIFLNYTTKIISELA